MCVSTNKCDKRNHTLSPYTRRELLISYSRLIRAKGAPFFLRCWAILIYENIFFTTTHQRNAHTSMPRCTKYEKNLIDPPFGTILESSSLSYSCIRRIRIASAAARAVYRLCIYKCTSRDKDLQGCYPFIVAFVSRWLISPSCNSPALD